MPLPSVVSVQGVGVVTPASADDVAVIMLPITSIPAFVVSAVPISGAVVITPNAHPARKPGLVLGADGAKWIFGHGPPTPLF